MVFRKAGTLLPLERSILEVGLRRGGKGMYGFWLAQQLAEGEDTTALVAHGTLYKALDRMRKAGLLQAEWEDADAAVQAGRPRRRVYTVTAAGTTALRAVEPRRALRRSPGEVAT
jgi:DNA-binding PadR family transcriptional regulator